MLPWNMTPPVLDVDECLGPKWAQNFPEVGHSLQTGIERWSILAQNWHCSLLHILLFMQSSPRPSWLMYPWHSVSCSCSMGVSCTQWSLWQQGTNVYDPTLQTEILDVATSQQEETSEECVFLIFLLPEKWRVLSVWLTSMFFTCDIFKLRDPALIGMQKVWLFSRPTPKGLSARDRWQQELGVGHLQVYNGGRKLKRNSFRIDQCQPYVKAKRFDEKEVHRLLSYENIMCIWKQTEKLIQNKGSFLSSPAKNIFTV